MRPNDVALRFARSASRHGISHERALKHEDVTYPVITKAGETLTEEDVERIADEFEAGFDLSTWTPRPGRPGLEPGSTEHAPRIAVRLPDSLHRRVRSRAASEGRSVSQVVRGLLEEYVRAGG
jgi:predicted HicB family RNase H-like nuclease